MSNLFDRAKQIGLDHIRSWLPDGREDGGEWIARNPTRDDKKAGSFLVNLSTGQWIDNATSDRGGDAVSLYAFLNLDACTSAAQKRGYRNITGGVQAEAARAILEAHDPSYFPGSEDDFTPRKTRRGDTWAGWFPVKGEVNPLPNLDTAWYQDKWGKEIERWSFFEGKKLVMYVVRFVQGKTKNDRPFTLWSKSGKYKWRAKAPEDRYPLWNLQEIEDRVSDAIILCEGQKAASRGKDCEGLNDYIFTGWYGGAGNPRQTEWSPLRGRTVYFWPDSDAPGRKAIKILREIATEYDINLSIVPTPIGVPKGWDLADAIKEGRDIPSILEPVGEGKKSGAHFLDDMPLPFDLIGVSGSDLVFYAHASNRIERYAAHSLTKFKLMTLAPRNTWGEFYAKEEGGIAWDAAIDDIIQAGAKKPVFDWRRVRGAGAWLDDGDVLINTGDGLIINGEVQALHNRVGHYVYEKQQSVGYRVDGALSLGESKKLLDCLKTISWTTKYAPYAAAGWMVLSVWGGILRWRPHLWIVGPSGTGKSWIMERIIQPICIDDFGVKGGGTSTMAGVRQSLQNSAKPFMSDEMESDNKKQAEQIEQILGLFRGSSSGQESGGITLHGSQDGEGKQWVMQSMACFASVGAAIKHSADASRFTICELKRSRAGIEEHRANFSVIEKKSRVFTKEYAKALHARTYSKIDELLKSVRIMTEQASKILGTMRDGDQIGALMGGAWMSEHDEAPTAAEAHAYLKDADIEKIKNNSDMKNDEEICLDQILTIKVELSDKFSRSRMTVGSALELWYGQESGTDPYLFKQDEYPGVTQASIKNTLEQMGLKPVYQNAENILYVATAHPVLQKELRETAWASSYSSILSRLEGYRGMRGPTNFAGVKKRFLDIKLEEQEISF